MVLVVFELCHFHHTYRHKVRRFYFFFRKSSFSVSFIAFKTTVELEKIDACAYFRMLVGSVPPLGT